MKEQIGEFLNSDQKEFKLPYMISIKEFNEILKTFGYDWVELDGDEINGWQVDFWYRFHHEVLPIVTLSGSLYYGDFKLTKE